MTGAPIMFAAVAEQLAEQGWRPFPGWQASKIPAMRGWPGLNVAEWDAADLEAAIRDYEPADDFCCCLAVQPEIVAIDLDIVDHEQAAAADKLVDDILGKTPLIRIGLAPKQVRIYRSGELIRSRKLHPLEIFCGSGQIVGFGWHAKAGRPYIWPKCSPLDVTTDSDTIPLVKRAQLDRFSTELFKIVPRRLLPTKQGRPSRIGSPQTISERLAMLTMLHGSWRRGAGIVLGEAEEGFRNETAWAVIASASGRGIPDDVVWHLLQKHFCGWDGVSDSQIASMMERTRSARQPSQMTFITPVAAGGSHGRRR